MWHSHLHHVSFKMGLLFYIVSHVNLENSPRYSKLFQIIGTQGRKNL